MAKRKSTKKRAKRSTSKSIEKGIEKALKTVLRAVVKEAWKINGRTASTKHATAAEYISWDSLVQQSIMSLQRQDSGWEYGESLSH